MLVFYFERRGEPGQNSRGRLNRIFLIFLIALIRKKLETTPRRKAGAKKSRASGQSFVFFLTSYLRNFTTSQLIGTGYKPVPTA